MKSVYCVKLLLLAKFIVFIGIEDMQYIILVIVVDYIVCIVFSQCMEFVYCVKLLLLAKFIVFLSVEDMQYIILVIVVGYIVCIVVGLFIMYL